MSEKPKLDSVRGADLAIPQEVRSFDKTPMFSALHAQRYLRQNLILEIEQTCRARNRPATLICYVSNGKAISRDDFVGIIDLLQNIPASSAIDLLLHTPGGDVDAAEKIIRVIRKKVGDDGMLRVVVPDFAKSAGTLMALGANSIVMSDCSELGPIDPQFSLMGEDGTPSLCSVLSYLSAFERAKRDFLKNPNDPAAMLAFQYFNPVAVKRFEGIHQRVRTSAENLLKPRGLPWTKIVSELLNMEQLLSHGQMVGYQEAAGMGLSIDYLDMGDSLWRKYWLLYSHLRLAVSQVGQRIFESTYVSLTLQ